MGDVRGRGGRKCPEQGGCEEVGDTEVRADRVRDVRGRNRRQGRSGDGRTGGSPGRRDDGVTGVWSTRV